MGNKKNRSSVASSSLLASPERIIRVYRGWDAFERINHGPQIIDFDLSNITDTAKFTSRNEILIALTDLFEQLDNNSPDAEFLRDKIQGSIFYLRAMMGQQIPFHEYVLNTLGTAPRWFPDEEILDVQNRVNELLAFFGLRLKLEDKSKFEERLIIQDPEEIKRSIMRDLDFWISRLREEGIPSPQKLPLHVEFTKVDEYWSNWTNGSLADGIKLRINLHSRKKYDLGKPMTLCFHEICGHAVQMSIWGERISQGQINHACGLTTVHSPEMFVAEGLGQTVSDLLGNEEDFPREYRLSRWLQYYTLIVLHNAHLMIYEGLPIEEIMNYAANHLPFAEPEMLEAEIRDRATNPLNRTYQLSYALAENTIRGLIKCLTLQQKRKFFLEVYTRPMTPKQLQTVARAVGEKGFYEPV